MKLYQFVNLSGIITILSRIILNTVLNCGTQKKQSN